MKRVILCLGLFICSFLALQTFTFAAGCRGGKCVGSSGNAPHKPPRTEFHQSAANIPHKPPRFGGSTCKGGKCINTPQKPPRFSEGSGWSGNIQPGKPPRTEFHESAVNVPQKPPMFGGAHCKGGKCMGSATNIEPHKPPLNNGSSFGELNHNSQVGHVNSNDLGPHFTENKPTAHRCPPGSKCAGLGTSTPIKYDSVSNPKPTVNYKGK